MPFQFTSRSSLKGIHPSARELADAPVIERWRLLPIGPGADILAGFVRQHAVAEPVTAIDVEAGWARIACRWLILGVPAARHPGTAIDWKEILRNDPLPNDAESMIAWAKRNLFGD